MQCLFPFHSAFKITQGRLNHSTALMQFLSTQFARINLVIFRITRFCTRFSLLFVVLYIYICMYINAINLKLETENGFLWTGIKDPVMETYPQLSCKQSAEIYGDYC